MAPIGFVESLYIARAHIKEQAGNLATEDSENTEKNYGRFPTLCGTAAFSSLKVDLDR
jgi:hypothetical protein